MQDEMGSRAPDKRVTVLEAARALCHGRDLESVKMAEIATKARVSKGTLYRFFKSKEDLLCAMVIGEQEALCVLVEELGATDGPAPHKLRTYVQGRGAGTAIENVALNIQALCMAGRRPDTAARVYGRLRELHRAQHDGMQRIVQAGIDKGEFSPDLDTFAVTTAIISFCDGFSYRASFDETYQSAEVTDRLFSQVIRILLPRP